MPTSHDAPPLPRLLRESARLLEQMYDPSRGLYPYSTRRDGAGLLHDFRLPASYRYTVNVLAGLSRADACDDLDSRIEHYLDRHLELDTNLGNRGLLLHLLSERGHAAAAPLAAGLAERVRADALRRLPTQEICWVALGLFRFAALDSARTVRRAARRTFALLHREVMHGDTLLPRADLGPRGTFVSFGALTYFIMALQEYARAFGSDYAAVLAHEATLQAAGLQGEDGAWPWFIDCSTARVMDWYPIYSVHQGAMAPLFLLPALERAPELDVVVRRGYRWLFGDNELGVALLGVDPFFIRRSIRQRRGGERPRRLLDALARKVRGVQAGRKAAGRLTINEECRSYHLGWILHAWAGREEFAEFTELTALDPATEAATTD